MVLGGLVRRRSSAAVLGSGANPTVLATGDTQAIAELSNYKPMGSYTRSDAIALTAEAEAAQASVVVAKTGWRAEEKKAQAYLDYITGNMDHATYMMKINTQLERKQAQFGKAVARYDLNKEATQAGYDAYTSVLQSSVATFSGM